MEPAWIALAVVAALFCFAVVVLIGVAAVRVLKGRAAAHPPGVGGSPGFAPGPAPTYGPVPVYAPPAAAPNPLREHVKHLAAAAPTIRNDARVDLGLCDWAEGMVAVPNGPPSAPAAGAP